MTRLLHCYCSANAYKCLEVSVDVMVIKRFHPDIKGNSSNTNQIETSKSYALRSYPAGHH